MMIIKNWWHVAIKSYSMWCWYIGGLAGALHVSILANTAHGVIPDSWVNLVDGYALTVMFLAGAMAGPLRFVEQPGVNAGPPK